MRFLQLSSCKALRGHCGPSCFLRSWVVIHGDYAWQQRGICQPGRYVLLLILCAAGMFCLPASYYCAHAVSFPRRAPEAHLMINMYFGDRQFAFEGTELTWTSLPWLQLQPWRKRQHEHPSNCEGQAQLTQSVTVLIIPTSSSSSSWGLVTIACYCASSSSDSILMMMSVPLTQQSSGLPPCSSFSASSPAALLRTHCRITTIIITIT